MKLRLLFATHIHFNHEPTEDNYENFIKLFDNLNLSTRLFDKIISPWLENAIKIMKLNKKFKVDINEF